MIYYFTFKLNGYHENSRAHLLASFRIPAKPTSAFLLFDALRSTHQQKYCSFSEYAWIVSLFTLFSLHPAWRPIFFARPFSTVLFCSKHFCCAFLFTFTCSSLAPVHIFFLSTLFFIQLFQRHIFLECDGDEKKIMLAVTMFCTAFFCSSLDVIRCISLLLLRFGGNSCRGASAPLPYGVRPYQFLSLPAHDFVRFSNYLFSILKNAYANIHIIIIWTKWHDIEWNGANGKMAEQSSE